MIGRDAKERALPSKRLSPGTCILGVDCSEFGDAFPQRFLATRRWRTSKKVALFARLVALLLPAPDEAVFWVDDFAEVAEAAFGEDARRGVRCG